MTARIIDGKAIAAEIREELRSEMTRLSSNGVTPGLGVVLVGDDPASHVYVRSKEKACADLGILSKEKLLPADISQEELFDVIDEYNNDPEIHGILVQLPLPSHIDESRTIAAVSPDKDIDGFHPQSIGKLVLGEETFVPCTPAGVLELLLRSGVEPSGKNVVVIGRSRIVGRPLANLLSLKRSDGNATVTVCHSRTDNLEFYTKNADILVGAMGSPAFIKGEMLKPGSVVIDVGISRVDDPNVKKGYRLVGDVDFESASKVAGAITPVPGGVGPMTIVMLMKNTILAAARANGLN